VPVRNQLAVVPEYSNVKNAHIVPRMYLANSADGDKIAVRLVREPTDVVQSIDNVGTRRRYYHRERPDGTQINDVEWTLGEIEPRAVDEAPLARGRGSSYSGLVPPLPTGSAATA
jgi:hypothetical protein